jgi:hypothetical protein
MPPLPERNRLMTLTAPRTIWLNVFTGDPDGEFPADHEGITWCEDEAGDVDVPYVRADINAQLIARVAELQAGNRRMRAALLEARRAIGDHHAPNDCYATGPMTGNPIRDLVECPACSAIAMFDAAIAAKD